MTRLSLFFVAATLLWAGPAAPDGPATGSSPARPAAVQQDGPSERHFAIVAKKYAFSPGKIEVYEGDLVQIQLKTEDIAHSFTIDAYRISKRVSPRHPIAFDFRADHAGTFPIYGNLQIDEGCRRMKGELVVRKRP